MIKRDLTLQLTPSPITTKVHFGHEILYSQAWVETLSSLNKKLVTIADSHIQSLLVDKWAAFLKKQGVAVTKLTFPAGEESKTREMKERLEDELFAHQCGKDTAIIAIGGGVATDLAGYVASTFCRGVSLLCIPTTLLCMVDAVIGGKTGVNTPFGKNLIGTYYPAEHIQIDTMTLSTLPDREWRNGLAEIIKHGLIRSPKLFQKLIDGHSQWIKKDPEFLQEVIYDSFLIKKDVVEADFQENGYRRILNFGHTVAHAIELLENYRIAHGEAVAVGMLAEANLSHRLGLLDKAVCEQIEHILKLFEFPLAISDKLTFENLYGAMILDKKAKNAKPRFVLLEAIGSPAAFNGAYCTTIDDAILQEVIISTLSQFRGAR
ncbi:MAG: 3-dehydroquinate synthase [Parachlamydiales bacterium]|nr:3-dehydroquinate synthase [Candidatus Acheromyda pituitae]